MFKKNRYSSDDKARNLKKGTHSLATWLGITGLVCTAGLAISSHYKNLEPDFIAKSRKPQIENISYEANTDLKSLQATINKNIEEMNSFLPQRSLQNILIEEGNFSDSEFKTEVAAFERVLKYKDAIDNLMKDYSNIDTNLMLAIMKQETQGKQGNQVNDSGANGLWQMTYFGAYSFLWNAMFSETETIKVKDGSTKIQPDYHNINIRNMYSSQLERIKNNLKKAGVLVDPKEKRAKQKTWDKLKVYMKNPFPQGAYNVQNDMACLYVDYLAKKIYDGTFYDGPDKENMVIAAYNAGPTAVREANGIPHEDDNECKRYVPKVKKYKHLFDLLDKNKIDYRKKV